MPSFVLGFHGCDKTLGEKILSGKSKLRSSTNNYDWLGNGIYFWENNPFRAQEYAQLLQNHPERVQSQIYKPFVLGAIIDLGYCLNFLETTALKEAKQSYEILRKTSEKGETPLPENKPIEHESDLLLRHLDCAVIEMIHTYNEDNDKRAYDSVRGVFFEGNDLYPNAGFKEKNHIQICVRNPNGIKGYFRVMEPDSKYPIP